MSAFPWASGTRTDRSRTVIGRTVIAFWLLVWAAAIGLVLVVDAERALDVELGVGVVLFPWAGLLFWLLIGAQPRNRIAWLFVWLGIPNSLITLSEALVIQATTTRGLPDDPTGVPLDDLGLGGAIGLFYFNTFWAVAIMPMLTLALAWFPDGIGLSRRWSIIPVLVVSGLVLFAFAQGWETWPFRDSGTAKLWIDGPGDYDNPLVGGIATLAVLVLAVAIALSLASMVVRHRRSAGSVRRQFRWILWGSAMAAGVAVPAIVMLGTLGEVADQRLIALTYALVFVIVFTSYTVAIWRHQLFDIDFVITKSITYVGIVAMITAVFVAVVVVLPRLVVGDTNDSLALPLAATAMVALLFEPARQRLTLLAERLVYGRRASPLQVLSRLTARLSASSDDGTDELAQVVAAGTGAAQVTVWVRAGDQLRAHGHWSDNGAQRPHEIAADGLRDDPQSITRAILHDNEALGAITVTKPRTDPINPADVELVDAVAGNAGLVLRHLSLNAQLRERASEVRASRRRLIAAQDAERHRLERDLHDGAQQHVVALKVKLGIARSMAKRDGNRALATAVDELGGTIQEAVDSMRTIAHGIYPPLLEAGGLATALSGLRLPTEVHVSMDLTLPNDSRYSRSIEETVYFCAIEILNRTAGIGARQIALSLEASNDRLRLEAVHDAAHQPTITAVLDRVDAAEGKVIDEPGRIVVTVPLTPKVAR